MIFYSPSLRTFFDDGLHPQIPEDARAVSTEQHAQLLAALNRQDHIAEDLSIHPRPSAAHEWNGQAWIVTPERAAARLKAAKADKIRQINAQAQAFIGRLAELDETPEFEIQTWAVQAAEAKAWHADKSAATPTLDTIAAARGVPAELLKQKAYEKTVKYEQATAYTVGTRQRYLDRIHTAQTAEELDAMAFVFELPKAV